MKKYKNVVILLIINLSIPTKLINCDLILYFKESWYNFSYDDLWVHYPTLIVFCLLLSFFLKQWPLIFNEKMK